MSRLTLRLPETLHQQLNSLAEREGVSLNQYIVYALTRQASLNGLLRVVSDSDLEQHQQSFQSLINQLGQISPAEIESVLATREQVEPEAGLSDDVVARIQSLIKKKA